MSFNAKDRCVKVFFESGFPNFQKGSQRYDYNDNKHSHYYGEK